MTDYQFETEPYAHQRAEVERYTFRRAHGLWWDPGTGKTKTVIDMAAQLFERGEINALLVFAPSGVHRNWVDEELVHLPKRVKHQAVTYQTRKARTKRHKAQLEELLVFRGLAILAMSYDGARTDLGHNYVQRFLRRREVLAVADEVHLIKNPDSKRTRRICALGNRALYRRALTGTPAANSALDVYAQIKFLEPNYWRERELHPYSVFKAYYGVWTRANGYDQLVGYNHLQELKDHLQKVGTRVRKDEVLDLPPKVFAKRWFELDAEQASLYNDLTTRYLAELEDEEVTAESALVRLLRLQQITCGYLGTDEGNLHRIGNVNRRLQLLLEELTGRNHQVIVWARFTEDVDQIMAALGSQAVRYDGLVSDKNRTEAIERFQNGDVKVFVAKPSAAGTGLTLHAARSVIYYSNSFSLTERLQSEDRAHRIGQEHSVDYIDIQASGTVDEHITRALRRKMDIASQLTGDALRSWL